ncbi:hypothetical protein CAUPRSCDRAFT_12598 [Caulochytrium protostelioides]|uniref:glutamate--tRNA ligase n=1 Tax=Caulochytrium protostelioides TaxID=1555241 RepID=A0A4P9WRH7_9FUNG|nr:hypothetical protein CAUPRSCDRAFT_12598 [Caulochytrium protostelioides]
MDWGNAYIRSVERDAQGLVTAITAELHLDGDFKKTKKKVTWLSTKRADDVTHEIVPVKLIDYDYLITKKKLEEEDAFEDFVTPQTFFETLAVADCNVRTLKKGDIIQFERKGYYIVDRAYDAAFPQTPVECILIPDGRQASLESKAVAAAAKASPAQASPSPKSTATDGAAVKPGSRGDIAGSRMYVVPPVYAEVEPRTASQVSKMYDMPTLFHADAQTATKLLAEAAASATTEAPAAAAAPAKEKKAKKTKPAPVVADPISKLDIVVGKIVDVRKHPDADSLLSSS